MLEGTVGGLETWRPSGAAEFPVAPRRLRSDFLAPAGVCLELPASPVDRSDLLALASAAPRLRLVEVRKRRRQFRLEGATAELTEAAVEDRPVRTVAVEDADRAAVARAVAALGLAGRRNVNYQRFLVEAFFPASESRPGP